jgi:regulator of cell morphogenesis and NO signaling
MAENLFLKPIEISPQSLVSDIVALDYRTADVFRRHGIEYCCSGKRPLEMACIMKGIDAEVVIADAQAVSRNVLLPGNLPYHNWDVDFLIDYIINIHHYNLLQSLPALKSSLKNFAVSHEKKYPVYTDILNYYQKLEDDIFPHMKYEEEVIFPYLRQVAHVYDRKESFGGLFIKTLRKPLSSLIDQEHKILDQSIGKFRQLTNNYQLPEKACTEQLVVLSKLKALDDDLVQHIYLENQILLPRVLEMEEKLLANIP